MFARFALLVAAAAALQPLCPDPASLGPDDVHINCTVETGSFAPAEPPPAPDTLTIVEYNIDRNGFGGDGRREAGMAPIVALLQNRSLVPEADVLLVSEASRGCAEYGGADFGGVAALAEALGLHYAYAVEFVETGSSNFSAGTECSIGNGLLSRFPLAAVGELRFDAQCCRYGGRVGGRVSAWADVQLSPASNMLRVHSAHLESGQSDAASVVHALAVRALQAAEVSGDLVGGDMNAPLRDVDPTLLSYQRVGGFVDAHQGLDYRVTCPDAGYPRAVLDYVLPHPDRLGVQAAGVCADEACEGWSDHVPIWAELSVLSG